MLKRVIILAALTLLPHAASAALPAAPVPTADSTNNGALLDSFTKSTQANNINKQQGIANYTVAFHDDRYQYTLPLCAEYDLVDNSGKTLEPPVFVQGDTLVVSYRPNAATPAKSCAYRILRDKIGRGPSGGECLQDFQVKHEVRDTPERLLAGTEYTYILTVYARPTLDCDGKAYGSAPITTVIAAAKPFLITLTRDVEGKAREVRRWSLSTDVAGRVELVYKFTTPSDSYRFNITPGRNATPGDVISWTASIEDPNPSPDPIAALGPKTTISPLPIILVLFAIFVVAGVAEYWHRVRFFRRESETPEDEYRRTEKIKWHD